MIQWCFYSSHLVLQIQFYIGPDLYRFVNAGGCYARSLRRPCNAIDEARVTGVDAESTSGECVPDLYRFIVVASGNAAAIE